MEQTTNYLATRPADVGSVRRGVLTDAEPWLDASRLSDALVMVTELVANVLTHTASEARIVVQVTDDAVCVFVHDDDEHSQPTMRPVDPTRVGGNGLRIVDSLADTWGTIDHPGDGKSVWFRLLR